MRKIFALAAVLIMAPVNGLTAKTGDATKAELEQMKKTVSQLQQQIERLEAKQGIDKPPEETESVDDKERAGSFEETEPLDGEEKALSPEEAGSADDKEKAKPSSKWKMQIEERDSFSDMQEAAPRPYDLTLDPEYMGFIPIPHTHAMIKFNARPRVDFTNDNTYAGNENMFVTAAIPVTGQVDKGGGYQFNVNAQGTRLSMDVRAPGIAGNPRFYYENDFAGAGTAYLNYRVRHLYGEFYNFVVGQTYTVFEDADAWPDTVDYEGPNSAISSRRPLVRYMIMPSDYWAIGLSIEKPTPQVDTSVDPTATSEIHAPEGGFQVRWMDRKFGHVQLATIFRNIGVSGPTVGEQDVFGWGVGLSANINLFKKDSFQAMLTYGHGIFCFMNDAIENGDAAFDAGNSLKPLPVEAAMAGYTHDWGKKFRSTGSFGVVNLENEVSQDWNAYHRTYYGSLNLVYQLFNRLSFGIEGLYGYKLVKSGASGQAWRGQLTIMYALFK